MSTHQQESQIRLYREAGFLFADFESTVKKVPSKKSVAVGFQHDVIAGLSMNSDSFKRLSLCLRYQVVFQINVAFEP
jgi:hypothetical protein